MRHRLERQRAPSVRIYDPEHMPPEEKRSRGADAVLDCGWGRLIFAHTFTDENRLADAVRDEVEEKRNIALYIHEPHVVLSRAPHDLFLDPSHTYRLWLATYRSSRYRPRGYQIRRLHLESDIDAVNRILAGRHMVPIDPDFLRANLGSRTFTYFVAEDRRSGTILGLITGVDHAAAFDDPENGSSLWCLAVDPRTPYPGVGRTLVALLADHYAARGRAYLDLSVMHDNSEAIALYEAMGFVRVPVFCIKRKNPINEQLFIGPRPEDKLNPYAEIIVNEARRRGISVEVIDAEAGYFRLSLGGRSIVCRESLSELTTAVAMSRCDDKRVTRRLLEAAGLRVPDQQSGAGDDSNKDFLERHGAVVVKPARGEQGQGVTANLRNPESLRQAIESARRFGEHVLLEQHVAGDDLRVIVIDGKVVAAAVRRPAMVVGNGHDDVRTLIGKQSRKRAAATGGESRIPVDAETERCLADQGFGYDDVPEAGHEIRVRENANLHTGGTIHDVTPSLSRTLREASERAARALDIPVVGLDLLVPDVSGSEYVVIEANERPGLANHEPQPTAERFIDLLFPQTVSV
jgi:GNAT-family acetyltransferase (TIGR03103 family)